MPANVEIWRVRKTMAGELVIFSNRFWWSLRAARVESTGSSVVGEKKR